MNNYEMLEGAGVNLGKRVVEEAGLINGEHIYLECSACNKKLVDIFITKPQFKYAWKVKAKCCYCENEYSFVTKIVGGFHVGGFHLEKEGDPDNVHPLTFVDHQEEDEDGTIVFHTKKN